MIRFFVAFVLLMLPVAIDAQTIEKKVQISALTENAKRYFYVPFEVPANVKSLSVAYEYDKSNGANVLDLGLFDQRFDESENSAVGFRGWSGGRRDRIFIAEDQASHGYIAGKIAAGTWRVALGLYKIAPNGVEVTIKVRFNEIDNAAQAEFDRENNKTFDFPKQPRTTAQTFNGYQWFRGDLHLHTFNSDGNWTTRGVLDFAQNNNLDFVGITDHNTSAHHREIDLLAPAYKNLLVMRGEEVTTYGGHFNVWGLPPGELIDFRATPKDALSLQRIVKQVHDLNLLASINHPTGICAGCDWSYAADWTTMDAVEIWNGAWDFTDEAALKKWDAQLQTNKKIVVVGSSDTHRPPVAESKDGNPIGTPTVHAAMKTLSQTEFLNAVKNGRVWISDAASNNYELEFSAFDGQRRINIGETAASLNNRIRLDVHVKNFPTGAIVTLVSNGQTLQTDKIESAEFQSAKAFAIEKDGYFRLEIRDAKSKMLALTNPIYITAKK